MKSKKKSALVSDIAGILCGVFLVAVGKESRHSKYKRSLAMAEWCNSGMVVETFACFRPRSTKEVWREEHKYWAKWRKIWFELAEHYKEAK